MSPHRVDMDTAARRMFKQRQGAFGDCPYCGGQVIGIEYEEPTPEEMFGPDAPRVQIVQVPPTFLMPCEHAVQGVSLSTFSTEDGDEILVTYAY